MPRFTFPKLKPRKRDEYPEIAMSDSDQQFPGEWERTLHIPINKAILDRLNVGDEVEVSLYGVVEGLQNDERVEGPDRTMLTLEVKAVEAYSEEEEAEEEMERGFNRGPTPINRRRA